MDARSPNLAISYQPVRPHQDLRTRHQTKHERCVGGTEEEPSRPLFESELPELLRGLVEAPGVTLLRLRERLEPLGDLAEAFVAGGLREARIHRLVFVGLAGNGALQVLERVADGLT